MAAKSFSKTLVWILLGLLVLGLGGYGVRNLSGNLRSIGSVGEAQISVKDYARALRQEMTALGTKRGKPVSLAEARDAGVTQQVLSRLVVQAAFDDEAARIGLSVGDANLRKKIVGMQQFKGPDGKFDRDGYRYALEQAGLSEAGFETDIRNEITRSILQGAIVSGITLPRSYTQTLTNYLGERREVSWAELGRGDLATGLAEPTEAQLQAYHDAHKENYTLPERKRITYAWLTPDMMLDKVKIDEAALRDAYAAHKDDYNTPERRLVERLVFPDAAAARKARARLDAGEANFEDLVKARGLELADIDLGEVTRDDLGDAAEAVFAAEVGAVVGPVQSSLGPALFRVNAKLAKKVTSFEDARAELRDELARDAARRAVDERIDAAENLLAGGATLEDLARETEMELGTIDWQKDLSEGIAADPAFREAAAKLTKDDYPEIAQLKEGGIFALRLDKVIAPELQPLDAVRAKVAAAWQADQVVAQLTAQVQPALKRLDDGATLKEAGLVADGTTTATRRSFVAGTPVDFVQQVFKMKEGTARVIPADGRIFVVKLAHILPPDPKDEKLQQLTAQIRDQAANSLSQDLFQLLADDIRTRAGINIDQAALNAVHANFQ